MREARQVLRSASQEPGPPCGRRRRSREGKRAGSRGRAALPRLYSQPSLPRSAVTTKSQPFSVVEGPWQGFFWQQGTGLWQQIYGVEDEWEEGIIVKNGYHHSQLPIVSASSSWNIKAVPFYFIRSLSRSLCVLPAFGRQTVGVDCGRSGGSKNPGPALIDPSLRETSRAGRTDIGGTRTPLYSLIRPAA